MEYVKLSWSQATTWVGCNRKWQHRYFDQIEDIPGPELIYGKKVHAEIEAYLNNEVLLKEPGSLGALSKNYVESMTPTTIQVEKHLTFEKANTMIHGYADVIMETSDGQKCVIDWKTSKKKPSSMKAEHKRQLHLYGYMADLKQGDVLIIAYPQYGKIFEVDYDPITGQNIMEWMLEVADKIRESHEYLEDAKTQGELGMLTANPTPLCGWCSYNTICPDSSGYQKDTR